MKVEGLGIQEQRILYSRGWQERLFNLFRSWEVVLTIIFFVVMAVGASLSPFFLDWGNLLETTFNFTEKAIIALPMMFIILCGDIDVSVGSIVALASLAMGAAAQAQMPTPVLVVVGLMVGLAAGMLNGFLITRFGIPAIAVTIGTQSLFRGISQAVLGDQAYTQYPADFAYLGQGYFPGTHVPFQLVLFLVLATGTGILLHRTTFGRKVYAIGRNPVASRFSGVPVDTIRFLIFSWAGLFSGLAAILLTSRIGSTRPNIAMGFELDAITSVVLGGVAITGGFGGIYGVVLANFLLGYLKFAMGLINIPGRVMNFVTGALLILSVIIGETFKRLRKGR
ncbi:MAG TPA: ABC transporter permease [Termitinemataceae bacterium]|nr:ABC transporter permease [Termitinemataceae bacterium]HOM24241.1 ABC transporter permease [Termitinemataceae bacterium]HPQ01322.1 ABC transporter permease [Termitinemataceae bacterium]